MRELQRKQRVKKLIYSWPSLLLLVILSALLLKGAIGIFSKEHQTRVLVKDLESKAENLYNREEFLNLEIEKLRTQEGIIEEIKRKFSVTRRGEYVAIIVNEKSALPATGTTTLEWLKKLWQGIIPSLWRDK